jgi:MFS transporter, Spinster family, sphingosine-1-phosphate transporter
MKEGMYNRYLLVVLTAIVTFNYVDRVALGVMLQGIKVDLQLSDAQLGFLSGIAFALFYSVLGIPIARWADRGNRRTIISLAAAVWSVAVALCGLAANFSQLLLIRVGVAVGEAGCIPPAFSLMADHFTRAERPRAAAIYGLGGPLAGVIGYSLAGWLNEFYGWRATFLLLGIPGLVLGLLVRLTLKEPRLSKSAMQPAAHDGPVQTMAIPGAQAGLKEVFVTLWAIGTFRHLLFGLSVMFFFIYGISLWQPTFFLRSYGLNSGELGTWFAVTYGAGGVIGSYLGGELAFRFARHNERVQLKAVAIAVAICGVLSTLVYLSPNRYLAFALMGFAAIGQFAVNGPIFATIQTLVPERMRAIAFALVYLCANLIGMGLGPLAAGALSDVLHSWVGVESLRYSLLILAPGYLWVAWHFWRASGTVTQDLKTPQCAETERVGADLLLPQLSRRQ